MTWLPVASPAPSTLPPLHITGRAIADGDGIADGVPVAANATAVQGGNVARFKLHLIVVGIAIANHSASHHIIGIAIADGDDIFVGIAVAVNTTAEYAVGNGAARFNLHLVAVGIAIANHSAPHHTKIGGAIAEDDGIADGIAA
ncbi:hypothetical protein FACS1894158_15740 [Betaproteobacteria bacterium]|nr:hypothetical protein FACS1894158_15740 [Betaproteobacteria bacterium]